MPSSGQPASASTTLLVLLFVRVAGVDKVVAYLAAVAPVTVSTFVANRVWAFADRSEEILPQR